MRARLRSWILAGLALGLTMSAAAQTPVAGSAGVAYGAHVRPPGVMPPPYPYPHSGASYPDPLRLTDELPSCYRFGRCTLRDIERFRDRPHRLERLAPTAPASVETLRPSGGDASRSGVAPTPEENIRPEYRGASLPREEFRETDRSRAAREPDAERRQ